MLMMADVSMKVRNVKVRYHINDTDDDNDDDV